MKKEGTQIKEGMPLPFLLGDGGFMVGWLVWL